MSEKVLRYHPKENFTEPRQFGEVSQGQEDQMPESDRLGSPSALTILSEVTRQKKPDGRVQLTQIVTI
jgi:hypothetical protein